MATGGAGAGGGVDALYNQGVIAWNAGKAEDAKKAFEEALKVDPKHANSHYQLGMCFVNLGKMPEAVAEFESYIQVAPDGQYAAQAKALVIAVEEVGGPESGSPDTRTSPPDCPTSASGWPAPPIAPVAGRATCALSPCRRRTRPRRRSRRGLRPASSTSARTACRRRSRRSATPPTCRSAGISSATSSRTRRGRRRRVFACIQSIDGVDLLEAVDRAAADAGRTARGPRAGGPGRGADQARRRARRGARPRGRGPPGPRRPPGRARCCCRRFSRIPRRCVRTSAGCASCATSSAARGVPPALLRELSMGMSHDFEVAIEEGATMVRVGTAIFGPRARQARA